MQGDVRACVGVLGYSGGVMHGREWKKIEIVGHLMCVGERVSNRVRENRKRPELLFPSMRLDV